MREFLKVTAEHESRLVYAVDDKLELLYCKFPEELDWRMSAFGYDYFRKYEKSRFFELNPALENE